MKECEEVRAPALFFFCGAVPSLALGSPPDFSPIPILIHLPLPFDCEGYVFLLYSSVFFIAHGCVIKPSPCWEIWGDSLTAITSNLSLADCPSPAHLTTPSSCLPPSFSQFSLVAQSYSTLCDTMNHSTPGLPVHHQLPEFTQTQVHRVGDAIQPSHPLSAPSPPAPNPSQYQGLFQ